MSGEKWMWSNKLTSDNYFQNMSSHFGTLTSVDKLDVLYSDLVFLEQLWVQIGSS